VYHIIEFHFEQSFIAETMTKNNQSTPQKMSAMEKKNGKSGLKSPTKKQNLSKGNVLLVSESSPFSSTALTVSS
jgi:hypothetical protein